MGFDASDLEAVGSARPVAVELAGGPLVYTALVTEVEEDGLVTLGIPAGSWTDADGSWGPEAFGPSVTVDTRAPVIQGEVFETGELRTGTEPGKAGAVVFYEASLSGSQAMRVGPAAAPEEEIECVPASGSFFPIGSSTVDCTATDPSGNTATTSFTVSILAAEAGEPGDDEPGDELGDEEESGDEELPETGASTGGAGLRALALLGVGAGLVLVRRRVEA